MANRSARTRCATALLACVALLASADPCLGAEVARAAHEAAVAREDSTCCKAVKSCCEREAKVPAAAEACPCCLPTTPAPPVGDDAREATVSESESKVEAAAPDAIVSPLDLPRPTSTPVAASIGPESAGDPPIFLRTCHLRF